MTSAAPSTPPRGCPYRPSCTVGSTWSRLAVRWCCEAVVAAVTYDPAQEAPLEVNGRVVQELKEAA